MFIPTPGQGLRPTVVAQSTVWTGRALQGDGGGRPSPGLSWKSPRGQVAELPHPCPRCSVHHPVRFGVTLDGPAAEDTREPRLCSEPGLWSMHSEDTGGGGMPGGCCLVLGPRHGLPVPSRGLTHFVKRSLLSLAGISLPRVPALLPGGGARWSPRAGTPVSRPPGLISTWSGVHSGP